MFNFDYSYTKLNRNLYSFVSPEKIKKPQILIENKFLLNQLNIENINEIVEILKGEKQLENTISQAYAGHQFGHFTILGDGRAVLLGEHITRDKNRFDIQLKGSGRTPYSRSGDGKASVGSMMREYIYSIAMESLNIKTSKSLAVILTNQDVYRETIQNGAQLVRVMNSHIRIGTFEYVKYTGDKTQIKELADYTINRHFPEIGFSEDRYIKFFEAVMINLIDMVIDWMRVGFVHGVMNTDNMSITGETFDYGPCAFINSYSPQAVFSSIDATGRYSFKNQKPILMWNLARFAETLIEIIDQNPQKSVKKLNSSLNNFNSIFNEKFYLMMKLKLGIDNKCNCNQLIDELLELLKSSKADYTNTFIELANPNGFSFDSQIYKSKEFLNIKKKLCEISGLKGSIMEKVNPCFIPRNYIVEEAIDEFEQKNSLAKFNAFLEIIKSPYKCKKGFEKYQTPPSLNFDLRYKTYCNT